MSFRDMTTHQLTPMRHYFKGNHLVCNAVPDATEAAKFEHLAVPAGRCMHLVKNTGSGQMPAAKLGCEGNAKIPVYIYRDSDSYSGGYAGPDPAVSTQVPWAEGEHGNILMFVGLEGFELATTEFDKARTYTVGDYLIAPEHNTGAGDPVADARNVAGVLTNNGASFGSTTIIGMVSPGVYEPLGGDRADGALMNEFNVEILTFYTTLRPPLQTIPAGLTEPVWAV